MQDQPITFKNTLILYYALLAGQILIGLTLFYMVFSLSSSRLKLDMSFGDIKQLLVLLLVPGAIMISHYLYSNKIREGKQLKGFEEKLIHFRQSSILRLSLIHI